MPQSINVNWDKSEWLNHFNNTDEATQRTTQVETEITALNAWAASEGIDIEATLNNVVTGEKEINIVPQAVDVDFDFNEILKSEWGNRFLKIFSRQGIII